MDDWFKADGPVLWSFSGGRTSAYMMHRAISAYGGKLPENHIVVFANTGQEDSRTLDFVDRCDKEFGLGVVWVEAIIRPEREGTIHKVTSYEEASRNGEPFEGVIKKYGIPNKGYPHCTRELKLAPITSYARSVLGKSYKTAIGIRADESDRVRADKTFFYPLMRAGIRKRDVVVFWQSQEFDLEVPEHMGNCTWCWKKSDRKLMTLMVDNPDVFKFPERMESEYGMVRPERGRQVFFRNGRGVSDIRALASMPFDKFIEKTDYEPELFDFDLDRSGGECGEESCEVGEAIG